MDKKLMKQIVRFLFVGGTAFVIDSGILMLLTEVFHVDYLLANIISFSISVLFNYIMSVMFVFDVENKMSETTMMIFIISSVIGLGLNELIMYISVDIFDIMIFVSKIVATSIVMVYNFVSRKLLLEKKK